MLHPTDRIAHTTAFVTPVVVSKKNGPNHKQMILAKYKCKKCTTAQWR